MAIPPPRPGAAALITGASSGIGAEVAKQLAARGHDLVIVARRRERLEALAAELRARHGRRVEILAADVADRESRAELLADIERLGLEIDVFIPSAGFGLGGLFAESAPERLELLVRTNVEAVVAMTRALVPQMIARRSGAILIVSSTAGAAPMPNFGTYAATKAAMTSFAETLHWELGRHGITVTALCPGGVWTEFAEVAGMDEAEDRTPKALMIGVEDCVTAALAGLERGDRIVMPKRTVRAFAAFGKYGPRKVWLPLVGKLLR
jgi:hypothetical protein